MPANDNRPMTEDDAAQTALAALRARSAAGERISQSTLGDANVRTADGSAWDGNGRYCRWNLPTHNGRAALGPDADFQKIMSGQRDRIMRQGDGEGSN
jgi:hypothetical protein